MCTTDERWMGKRFVSHLYIYSYIITVHCAIDINIYNQIYIYVYKNE